MAISAESADANSLVLLPHTTEEAGHPLYLDDDAGQVKLARAYGLNVDYATPADTRYLSEYSAGDLIAQIYVGVLGNLTTDALKMMVVLTRLKIISLLGSRGETATSDRVKISIAELEFRKDSRKARGVTVEMPASHFSESDETVANILRSLIEGVAGCSIEIEDDSDKPMDEDED